MGHPAPGDSVRVMENLSHMLHEMLKILSQPPVWLSSAFSAIMGTVVGFFGGLFRDLIVPDLVARRGTRRALYQDLAQMFFAVDLIMNIEQSEIGAQHADPLLWRQDQFRQFPFLGEEYYSDNPAIYIQYNCSSVLPSRHSTAN